MSNLTCEKLEHYILLIVAAEQNLVEYQKIRDKLDEVTVDVNLKFALIKNTGRKKY